jgi:hypothetical protein
MINIDVMPADDTLVTFEDSCSRCLIYHVKRGAQTVKVKTALNLDPLAFGLGYFCINFGYNSARTDEKAV